jgi:acetyl-CoA carboxylase beta subunit
MNGWPFCEHFLSGTMLQRPLKLTMGSVAPHCDVAPRTSAGYLAMKRDNFAELTAREKALAVLDAGATRELLDPFARLESPHLSAQDIVPQSDDGVVIARGKIGGRDAVVVSMEGGFQGGSVGEVNEHFETHARES